MQKYADPSQLLSELQRGKNSSLYLIFGDDPFIQNQTINSIRQFYKNKGVGCIRYYDGSNFNWTDLENSIMSYGLFESSQLIIINIVEKIPKELTANIKTLSNAAKDDTTIIIYGQHLTKVQENSKWFSELTLNPQSIYLSFYTPGARDLPKWFAGQARNLGLNLDIEVQNFLTVNFEGNLSSGYQVLYNMYLQGIQGEVNLEQVKQQTISENHFSTFDLTDSLLVGTSAKALRIIKTLQEDRCEIKPLLWVINRDLSVITEIRQAEHNNLVSNESIFKKYGINAYKKENYIKAARNCSPRHIAQLTSIFAKVDFSVMNEKQAWEMLETFVVGFKIPGYLSKFSTAYEK